MCRFAGRTCVIVSLVCAAWLLGAGRAEAQLGNLISPGRLAQPHSQLEGLGNCQKCHEQGNKVTAQKCLSCHKPVADRIARQTGVHRDVKGDCVKCHAEHAGADGELRPFDTRQFDHARVTGFALDGKHARVAGDCVACHKSRSFVTLSAICASCHTDVHKGALGRNCTSCHSTQAAFKELGGRFDHSKSAFPLAGAHRNVSCASCHVNKVFKGLKFSTCTDCHRSPHQQELAATCTACHASDTWRTRKFDHARTAFPLVGRHINVECASCHKQGALKAKPKADTCASCHVDVHKGTFRQDCKACHSESGFEKAPFDHSGTTFALTGKHTALACMACHKNVTTARGAAGVPAPRASVGARAAGRAVSSAATVADFRGLKTACISCHRDVHNGELGATCESCHSSADFHVAKYVHRNVPEFFTGQHAPVACSQCHVPGSPTRPIRSSEPALKVTFKTAVTRCASCHEDVHLGQEGGACDTCHSISHAKFAAAGFSHAKTTFNLTGKHKTVPCVQCHKRETGTFPAKAGTAVRYKGVSTECRACHEDVHQGQVAVACDTCHATESFKLSHYQHANKPLTATGFFAGRHARIACEGCHRKTTASATVSRVPALQFKTDARCVACHVDKHRGALGPNCRDCHRL
jgi:hypothetical protein